MLIREVKNADFQQISENLAQILFSFEDLQTVVKSWPDLSADLQASIVKMVR